MKYDNIFIYLRTIFYDFYTGKYYPEMLQLNEGSSDNTPMVSGGFWDSPTSLLEALKFSRLGLRDAADGPDGHAGSCGSLAC